MQLYRPITEHQGRTQDFLTGGGGGAVVYLWVERAKFRYVYFKFRYVSLESLDL